MVQKSGNHQLGCIKPNKQWDVKLPTWTGKFAGFLNHQPYHYHTIRLLTGCLILSYSYSPLFTSTLTWLTSGNGNSFFTLEPLDLWTLRRFGDGWDSATTFDCSDYTYYTEVEKEEITPDERASPCRQLRSRTPPNPASAGNDLLRPARRGAAHPSRAEHHQGKSKLKLLFYGPKWLSETSYKL